MFVRLSENDDFAIFQKHWNTVKHVPTGIYIVMCHLFLCQRWEVIWDGGGGGVCKFYLPPTWYDRVCPSVWKWWASDFQNKHLEKHNTCYHIFYLLWHLVDISALFRSRNRRFERKGCFSENGTDIDMAVRLYVNTEKKNIGLAKTIEIETWNHTWRVVYGCNWFKYF